MTTPRFTMLGDEDTAPVCVDGVCTVPATASDPAGAEPVVPTPTDEPPTHDDRD